VILDGGLLDRPCEYGLELRREFVFGDHDVLGECARFVGSSQAARGGMPLRRVRARLGMALASRQFAPD
jgi:hypothetical protein